MWRSIAKLRERGSLVEGDMIRFAALDLVLWIVRARMAGIALDLELACMHAGDRAADAPRLGVPAHAIMNFEGLRQGRSIRYRKELPRGNSRIECYLLERHGTNPCTSRRFLKSAISFD